MLHRRSENTRFSGAGSEKLQHLGALAVLIAMSSSPLLARAQTAAEVAKGPIVPPSPKRLYDGSPNWTGFWVPVDGMLERNIGLGGTDPAKDALMPRRRAEYSELKSPYKEQFAKFQEDAANNGGKVQDPLALCFPPGMPRMMGMIYGMELLQTPREIVITSEWQAESRRIWLKRAIHPPASELDPTYTGDSIGHWHRDTLVVDTVGTRSDIPVSFEGMPHSSNMHIREIFSEKIPGILEDEITIDDPDAYVKPWKQTQHYRYRPDLSIREYVCLENNRNVEAHGEAKFEK